MGCGIHLHTEIKVNGKWEHYSAPSMPRSYGLFEKMAGVRGSDDNAIAPPRGMPLDASAVTILECEDYGEDGHSHSWLNANEIAELEEWMNGHLGAESWRLEREWWGYLFGNSWGGWSLYPDERPEKVEDIRFVFWFDN